MSTWIDEHPIGWVALIALRLLSVAAAVLSLFDEVKIPAAAILIALGLTEAIGVAARRARKASNFEASVARCQRFVDAIFTYLLGKASDFRVTILLTHRDLDGKTFLRAFVRNSECSLKHARQLPFDDNGGRHEGVAGEAWKLAGNLSRSAPREQGDGGRKVVDERSHAYMTHMRVSREFLDAAQGGVQNSRYVLAGVLSYKGKKVGVLTVDAKEAFNILALEDLRLEDIEADKKHKAEAAKLQQMESIVFFTIQYLYERVLPDLFEEAA